MSSRLLITPLFGAGRHISHHRCCGEVFGEHVERLAGQLAEGSVNFAGIRGMFLSDAWHRLEFLVHRTWCSLHTACGNGFTVRWQSSWENKTPVLMEIWTDSHEYSQN